MIKLTEAQIDTLIERGYENVWYRDNGSKINDSPWYKDYQIDENTKFEIIINPYRMADDIVVGCSGEGDSDGMFDCFINVMDVLNELNWVKHFLVDSKVTVR